MGINLKNYILKIYRDHHKILLLMITLIVLIFRRPGQILDPYIWTEDGTVILHDYIKDGLLSFFYPVSGYYVIITKIINFLSYFISFWYYPEIAAFLANFFIIAVIFAIAYSPTKLKLPWLCAILTLFVNTDPECFGVALYSFWWAGLLLILATLWRDNCNIMQRIIYVLLGGFSSPLICFAAPVLCINAIIKKSKDAIWIAIISIIPFFFQSYSIMTTSNVTKNIKLDVKIIYLSVANFFGRYVLFKEVGYKLLFVAGSGLLLIFAYAVVKYVFLAGRNHFQDITLVIMFLWLGAVIFMVIARLDIQIIHPYLAGPRYFFYPFIIISWIIIYILGKQYDLASNKGFISPPSPPPICTFFAYCRIFVKGFLIVLVFNFCFNGSLPYMSRNHKRIDWRQELSKAILSNGSVYALPVAFDGYGNEWYINVTEASIINLVEKSLFPYDLYKRYPELARSYKTIKPVSILNGLNRIGLEYGVGMGPESFKWDDKNVIIPSGWAVDYISKRKYTQVYMNVNGMLFNTVDHLSSLDVAIYFGNHHYSNVRFSFFFPISEMNIGENNFSAIVILNDRTTYYETEAVTINKNEDGSIAIH